MKRKNIIEMLLYAVIAVMGILLLVQKPEEKKIDIVPDFNIETEENQQIEWED